MIGSVAKIRHDPMGINKIEEQEVFVVVCTQSTEDVRKSCYDVVSTFTQCHSDVVCLPFNDFFQNLSCRTHQNTTSKLEMRKMALTLKIFTGCFG